MIVRLWVLGFFFIFLSQASALTFKSGESINSQNQRAVEIDLDQIDQNLLSAQRLLQKFSYVNKPPTGQWDADYVNGVKRFYQNDFGQDHNGGFSETLLADLQKRRLVLPPLQGTIDNAAETFDISALSLKKGFDAELDKEHFKIGQFGFTAVSSSEMSPLFCYPTPTDCTDDNRVFSPNPHNAISGDFNGDGYEDMAISWIYFTHTMPRAETPSHIRFYLNDGKGNLISTPSIYKNNIMPLRHFMYRLVVADFNGDGVDDVFSGSMGVIKRVKNIGMISDYEPHVLLLSDGNGQLYDASHQIEGQEYGGLARGASFAHTSSAGDVNCDGIPDIYAGGILLINDGEGRFENHTRDLSNAVSFMASPPKGASVIDDFNGDGCGDIITFDFDGNGHAWISQNGQHNSSKVIKILMEHSYGDANMQVNNSTSGDLDGDGLSELVATIHRKNPYYEGRRVVILKYLDGQFIDVSANSITDLRDQDGQEYLQAHGEGSIRLLDHDNDGDLDIIDTHGGSYEENGRFGMSIFKNDGHADFTTIPQDQMVMVQEQMIKGMNANRRTLTYGYPINIDNQGQLDYVSFTMMPWERDRSSWIGYTVLGK